MELKEAFEAATENVDVRPGFLGDVMTGARKRRTRKLLITTAVVALVAGGIAGGLLTRSTAPEHVSTADQRFATPTRGSLAQDDAFLQQVLKAWHEGPKPQGLQTNARTHVYWAGDTPAGEAAVVLQQEAPSESGWQTTVGVVVNGQIVTYDSQRPEYQQGVFRIGANESVYLVMERSLPIQFSQRATRDADGRLSREWQRLPLKDGVGIVQAGPGDRPMFLPADHPPAPDDFGLDAQLLHAKGRVEQRAFTPHTGLGWNDRRYATAPPLFNPTTTETVMEMYHRLREERLVDYQLDSSSSAQWSVVAGLPDGRTALVTEVGDRVFATLFRTDGTIDRTLVGQEVDKARPVPVRFVLPDDQGTVLAHFGATINDNPDALLVSPGTTEVRLKRDENITTVLL